MPIFVGYFRRFKRSGDEVMGLTDSQAQPSRLVAAQTLCWVLRVLRVLRALMALALRWPL